MLPQSIDDAAPEQGIVGMGDHRAKLHPALSLVVARIALEATRRMRKQESTPGTASSAGLAISPRFNRWTFLGVDPWCIKRTLGQRFESGGRGIHIAGAGSELRISIACCLATKQPR